MFDFAEVDFWVRVFRRLAIVLSLLIVDCNLDVDMILNIVFVVCIFCFLIGIFLSFLGIVCREGIFFWSWIFLRLIFCEEFIFIFFFGVVFELFLCFFVGIVVLMFCEVVIFFVLFVLCGMFCVFVCKELILLLLLFDII